MFRNTPSSHEFLILTDPSEPEAGGMATVEIITRNVKLGRVTIPFPVRGGCFYRSCDGSESVRQISLPKALLHVVLGR